MRTGLIGGLGVLAIASAAEAAYVINVGTHNLLPNTAGQTISLYVTRTNSELVSAIDLYAQIGDGGVDNGGTGNGPWITGMDLLTGTILAGGQHASYDPGTQSASNGMIYVQGADYPGAVAASGKFATVTVSTLGIYEGAFTLNLNGVMDSLGPTDDFDTTFTYLGQGYVAQVTPGLIAVPEPMTVGMFATVSLSALAIRPTRRQKD